MKRAVLVKVLSIREEKHCGHLDMLFVASYSNHELKLHALSKTCYVVGSYSEICMRTLMELCSLNSSLSLVHMNIYVYIFIYMRTHVVHQQQSH